MGHRESPAGGDSRGLSGDVDGTGYFMRVAWVCKWAFRPPIKQLSLAVSSHDKARTNATMI